MRHAVTGIALILVLFPACRGRPASTCDQFSDTAPWHLDAAGRSSGLRVTGTVQAGTAGLRLTGTATTGEGTSEVLDYPLDSLRTTRDSLFFRFAPLGIEVKGRCVASDTVTVALAWPQPPFGPVAAEGTLTHR
jgi:hypothetical protein